MKHGQRSSTGLILSGLAAVAALIPLPAAAQTFTTRILAHVPTPASNLALNDKGWVVWTTGLGNDCQTYLWGGSGVVTLGFAGRNNRDARINNNDWVVWSAGRITDVRFTEIWLWRGEGPPINLSAAIDTSAEPTINDLNDIAWWGGVDGSGISDVYYLAHNANQIVNLTAPDTVNAELPKLDNTGRISWSRRVADANGEWRLAFAQVSNPLSFTQASLSNDNILNGDMSDAGKLVWREFNDDALKYDIWQYDRNTGVRTNLTQTLTGTSLSEPAVSEDGTVIWHTNTTGPSRATLWWYKNGVREVIPISVAYNLNRPATINNRGQILFASGNGSATGFDIILATPSNAAPTVSGTITLEDIVPAAAAQRVVLTFHPSDNSPVFTRSVMLAPNGTFTVYDVPANNYVVHIKGKKWLAANVNVNTMGGSVTGVTATLKAGDILEDNAVDIFDLDPLIQAFNSELDTDPGTAGNQSSPNWNENADLNCDNAVDVFDLDLLIRNFNEEGAP